MTTICHFCLQAQHNLNELETRKCFVMNLDVAARKGDRLQPRHSRH